MSGGDPAGESTVQVPGCVDLRPDPLSRRASLGVGGAPRYLAEPTTADELTSTLRWATLPGSCPFHVLGGMSNVVVADDVHSGVIIPANRTVTAEVVEDRKGDGTATQWVQIVAGAGASLADVVRVGMEHQAEGIAALSGIPGSVGGAVVQNAGAYDFELADFEPLVTLLHDPSGTPRWVQHDAGQLGLDYRWSALQEPACRDIVWELRLRIPRRDTISVDDSWQPDLVRRLRNMHHAPGTEIDHVMHEQAVLSLRDEKGMSSRDGKATRPTVGSFFKNRAVRVSDPTVEERVVAWRLIGAAGFKQGEVVAPNVRLSTLHLLALENAGGATAEDVLVAADHVRSRVAATSGLFLLPEARLIDLSWPWDRQTHVLEQTTNS